MAGYLCQNKLGGKHLTWQTVHMGLPLHNAGSSFNCLSLYFCSLCTRHSVTSGKEKVSEVVGVGVAMGEGR